MIIEKIAPAKLVGADYNPREIEPHQLEALKRSIDRWGFVEPVIVNKRTGLIVGGHQRTKAAIELAVEEVPVTYVDLDDDAEKALNIALNKIAGDWDEQKLSDLLADLEKGGQDLEDLGFESGEIDELLKDLEGESAQLEGDLDEIPEPPAEPITQPGDLWQLGEHRLLCGDSTNAEDVARLMGGAKADLCFTDPPYNIGSENKGIAASASKAHSDLMSANWDQNFEIEKPLDRILEVMKKDCVVYVCTSHHLAGRIWAWMATWADHFQFCVWSKPDPMPSLMKRHWTWDAELIPYATRGKHVFNAEEGKHSPSTWRINKQQGGDKTGHPTQKPIALTVHVIEKSSAKNQVVIDMFLGSGTTLIAAEQTGRKCYAMEISPAYCDVAVKRWEQATGRKAERIK